MEKSDLDNRFTYHAPKLDQVYKYEYIRDRVKVLAERLDQVCPDCREKSIAINKLEEAVFWANASIARHG
jgi:hypothetical protein